MEYYESIIRKLSDAYDSRGMNSFYEELNLLRENSPENVNLDIVKDVVEKYLSKSRTFGAFSKETISSLARECSNIDFLKSRNTSRQQAS